MAEWPFPADSSPEKRERVAELFGKLEVRYGRWRVTTTLDGHTSTTWYRVLAKDATSVMIVSRSYMPVLGQQVEPGWHAWIPGPKRSLMHLHFTGEHYWLTLGESNTREFFRRVTSP